MNNILITGGLGYIGGRVAVYLKETDPDSRIIVTTRDRKRELPLWTKKITVSQMDVLSEDSIAGCLDDQSIDVIIHLAALNEIDSMKHPELAFNVNTLGTYRLLNHAIANNITRFVYFSTFHVYGKSSGSIITEESPTRSSHPYAITHRAAEDIVNYFNRYHNVKTLILRLSNGYGYPMDRNVNRWTLVFNDLCRQSVVTEKIILRSSGNTHRDFISLHDISRAVKHFLHDFNDWGDGLYNLGGEHSMSILNVADAISDVYEKKYKKKIKTLETQCGKEGPLSEDVKYGIEKLKKTGFTLKGNMFSEIDKTLSLCEGFIN